MNLTVAPRWLDQIVLVAPIARAGAQGAFYREVAAGRFRRLAEGAYLPSSTWSALSRDDRYRALVHAVALTQRSDLLFSHTSAAALWRLPVVGPWPSLPEATVGAVSDGQSRRGYTARKYALPDSRDLIDGVPVTTLARTIVDIARTQRLSCAVAMADHALSEPSRDADGVSAVRVSFSDLALEMSMSQSNRGMRRCRTAIELADGRSGSPGETVSRVGIYLAGLPMPELQHPVYDADGLIGIADFWWPQFNMLGEFDGHGKYLREELRRGQTVGDVVVAEKIREDRMRATGRGMTRWGWETARSLTALAAHLRSAGLRSSSSNSRRRVDVRTPL